MTASQPGPPHLRDVLADRYHRRSDAERIVRGIGLEVAWIAWDERPINTWQSILDEVRDRDLVETLIDLILREAPGNEDLQQAIRVYRDSGLTSAVPGITSRLARRHDFYRHIPLPPNYIPRPELLAEVRERLLAGTGGLALTSAIQVKQADVLHGMGGIGKSVLARALCDDPEVQAAFPHGILWATLGQTPDLTARLREWIETLGGIVGQTAPTLDQLRNTLAEALRDKACLLIADDAWRKAHLEPFCAGGTHCRLLITTRDAALAEGLNAGVYPVPVMAPDQAGALLEEWAGREVEAKVKVEIVRRLGYLPLAVRLAGAQLRAKDATEWLTSLDAHKLNSRRVEAVNDSLEATFGLSLDALESANRRLYVALAIFKEDEPIPTVAIAKLWSGLDGRSIDETTGLLADLADYALLSRSQGDGNAVSFHDLLRDFMVAESGAEGRVAAHRALLVSYSATQTIPGVWHTAPDDGYLYNHLAYHLAALTDCDPAADAALSALFVNQSWLRARVAQSGYTYDGYLSDLTSAWLRARNQIDAEQEPRALAICLRYALIRTSLNSLAENYTPELVVRAVETGLWSVPRALSILRRVPNSKRRADLAIALLSIPNLTPVAHQQVIQAGLVTVRTINDDENRVQMLTALAPHLTGELIKEGLVAAEAIENEHHRALALRTLAPLLSSDLALSGLAVVQVVKHRVEMLKSLVPYLPDNLFQVAQAIDDARYRAMALAILVPHLNDATREQALAAWLAAALIINDDESRMGELTALIPHLAGATRERAIEAWLFTVRSCQPEWYLVRQFADLAPHLTGEYLAAGLAAAETINHEELRELTLLDLMPHLTGESLQAGLAAAETIKDEELRVEALLALVPHLTGELFTEGLAAMEAIKDEGLRVDALADLAQRLTGAARTPAVQAGLAAAPAIQNERRRVGALESLAPHLADDLIQTGLTAALSIGDKGLRVQALVALLPRLTGAAHAQTLEAGLVAAQAVGDEETRGNALTCLAPHLTGDLVQTGLTVALSIRDEWSRRRALEALMPQVTEDHIQAGLTAALTLSDWWDRAIVLGSLAPHLTDDHLQSQLATALTMTDELARAKILVALVPHLTGAPREVALQAGLTAALTIPDKQARPTIVIALERHLTGAAHTIALKAGLAAALTITDEKYRVDTLMTLIPRLPGDLAEEGLAAAQTITHEGSRAMALADLARNITNNLVQGWLTAVQTIRDRTLIPNAFAKLAPHLTGDLSQAWLTAVLTISDEEDRRNALTALMPHLTGDPLQMGLAALLTAVLTLPNESVRVERLTALAPHLSSYLLQTALAAAQDINDEWARVGALDTLAPAFASKLFRTIRTGAQTITTNFLRLRTRMLAVVAPHLPSAARRMQTLANRLMAARAIGDERSRAKALVALLPHLTGTAQKLTFQAGLTAAQAIKNDVNRAHALATLLSNTRNRAPLLKAIHLAMSDYLWNHLQHEKREAVLQFCADPELFAPPILSPDTLAAIAGHIIEICTEWEWL